MADIPVPTPEPPGPERRQAPRPEPTGGDFLELVKRKERGKLKLYIGSAAGVGKAYRMINKAHDAWDASVTFDMMPDQFTTLRVELNHRESSVPYFAGPDGITPAGGNTGSAGSAVAGFTPDLRKTETRINVALLIKL